MVLSTLLGVLLMIISFAHFFIAWKLFDVPIKVFGGEEKGMITNGVLQTIMYLQISSCPHFVIFSTRVSGWFWESMPSLTFIIAVGGTQIVAMLISVYGWDVFEATAIHWPWGCAVLGISTVMFMALDVVKVLVIRSWSFELTAKLWPTKARREELAKRQAKAAYRAKVMKNINKMKKVVKMVKVIVTWKKAAQKKLLGSIKPGSSQQTVVVF
jgi:H+-transporting ATPase